jgi:alpha-N-arabinofuranosidase
MTAGFYADQYRRYAVYCRDYGDNRLYKIAGGPNSGDYNWTETLMREAGGRMQGLSLHYYTVPKHWGDKGSATNFDEAEYFTTMEKARVMEDLVTHHSTIMDRYDPRKRVALIPDEWGAWYNVEPGTNPGFLFQQNTLRDALLAGLNLNIFNNHADRVRMANIAQTINVLQSVIFTEGEKMMLTPTYWVYWLYQVHHDATLLPVTLSARPYRLGEREIDAVSVSASRDAAGKIHVSLVNLDPNAERVIETELRGANPKKVTGHALTATRLTDHNTFDKPDVVAVKEFKGARLAKGTLSVTLPPKSIVVLEVE